MGILALLVMGVGCRDERASAPEAGHSQTAAAQTATAETPPTNPPASAQEVPEEPPPVAVSLSAPEATLASIVKLVDAGQVARLPETLHPDFQLHGLRQSQCGATGNALGGCLIRSIMEPMPSHERCRAQRQEHSDCVCGDFTDGLASTMILTLTKAAFHAAGLMVDGCTIDVPSDVVLKHFRNVKDALTAAGSQKTCLGPLLEGEKAVLQLTCRQFQEPIGFQFVMEDNNWLLWGLAGPGWLRAVRAAASEVELRDQEKRRQQLNRHLR